MPWQWGQSSNCHANIQFSEFQFAEWRRKLVGGFMREPKIELLELMGFTHHELVTGLRHFIVLNKECTEFADFRQKQNALEAGFKFG